MGVQRSTPLGTFSDRPLWPLLQGPLDKRPQPQNPLPAQGKGAPQIAPQCPQIDADTEIDTWGRRGG